MDIEVKGLLRGTKLKELKKIQNLVLLKDSCTVEDALQVLAKYKILSAPVVVASENQYQQELLNNGQSKVQKTDSDNKNFASIQFPQDLCTTDVLGFVDIKDIIGSFMSDFDSKQIMDMKVFGRINYLEDKGLEFCDKNLRDLKILGTDGTFIHNALSSVSVLDLIYEGFLQPRKLQRQITDLLGANPPVVHRAAIFDNDGRILNIISQTDIVKFVLDNKSKLGPLADEKVIDLEIGTSPVVVAYPSMVTFEVLKIMS